MSSIVVVGTQAMHLADASATPVEDAIVSSILRSGVPYSTHHDIPSEVSQTHINSFGTKMQRVYEYAKDHYKLGLPGGESLGSNPINDQDLAPYIETDIAYPLGVVVTDYSYTKMNALISISSHLINVRDYDRDTNIVNNWPPGVEFTSYWGEDVNNFPQRVTVNKVLQNEAGTEATILYELSIYRSIIIQPETRETSPIIETKWVSDPTIVTETVAIPNYSTIRWNSDCLIASYYKLDAAGEQLPEWCFWVYQLADNLYPELHPGYSTQNSTFLPVVPIRHNNTDLTDPTTQNTPEDPTNLFSTSKKLLSFLDIRLEDIGARLNENPDIADIDHAYIMWGVDLQTNHPESLYYLNDFFSDLHHLQYSNETDFLNSIADPDIREEPISRYVVNDSGYHAFREPANAADEMFTEYGLILDIQYDYVDLFASAGVLNGGNAKIGYAEKSFESYQVTIQNWVRSRGDAGDDYIETTYETRYKVIIKAQVDTNVISTVTVYNPVITNWVYGRKRVITKIDDIINDADNHNLIIPLQYNITEAYGTEFKSILYTDTMLLVINAVEWIKLKWYQTKLFKVIVMVVAIVLFVWTAGQSTWLMGLTAAMGEGLMATLVYLGMTALVMLAINLVAKILVKMLGPTFGLIIGVIMFIMSAYMGMTNTDSSFMMMTPATMAQVSSALISTSNEFLIEEGAKIRNEFEVFSEHMEGLWDELDTIEDLLDFKADIDPLLFTRPNKFMIVPHENPSQFFNRCLSLPDHTVFTVHDDIYNFFDTRLTLDKNVSKEMQQSNLYR